MESIPKESISSCFEAVNNDEVEYAVVPFENSTNGLVVYTLDLLRDWFLDSEPLFRIVGEQFVAIHHCLLSNAGSLNDIETIYSHPQVWGQVGRFLKDFPRKYSRIDTSSTSKAAELVADDKTNTSACISSQLCSLIYKLPVLNHNIEDNSKNTTRFLVLSKRALEDDNEKFPYITSIMFTLRNDDPGTLCGALDSFRQHGVNLTAISLRPSHIKQWQYVFFVEIIGSERDENVQQSLTSLRQDCNVVIVGSFRRCGRYYEPSE